MRVYPALFRFALWGMILAGGGCTPAGPVSPSGPTVVTFGILTGLGGTTAPCGCTSDPLGGLDRVAARVEALRAEGPFELLVVGDTFFESARPPAHRYEAEVAEATVIATVLGRLRPAAILLGPTDVEGHFDTLRRLGKDKGIPVLDLPRTPQSRSRAASMVHKLGGLSVGILGVPGEATAEAAAYVAGATALRAHGVDLVLGLFPTSAEGAREFVARTSGITVMIAGGSEKPWGPRTLNGRLVVEAGDKGQYLGLLRLHPKFAAGATRAQRREWVYNDEGRGIRDSLDARIERLKAAVARMEPGEARGAREKMLGELTAERAAFSPPTPEGSYITYGLERIDKSVAPASWATALLAEFNRSLCPLTMEATADLPCPVVPTRQEAYVGSTICEECHPEATSFHGTTAHASAWKSLTDAGKECDLQCIGCHTVGYERAGGYCRLVDAASRANVGCESCHGPSAGHADHPEDKRRWARLFLPDPGESVCLECHTPEHSDTFDFATYRQEVVGQGHGE